MDIYHISISLLRKSLLAAFRPLQVFFTCNSLDLHIVGENTNKGKKATFNMAIEGTITCTPKVYSVL